MGQVSSTLVQSVERVCRERISPAALSVDDDVVPRSHLDALAATGIFAGVGAQAPAAQLRLAHETLAGSCLSTWFVVAQHQTPLQLVNGAPEPLRSAVLPMLASGTSVAGIAFSHLRRWPQRPVEVERCAGGWRFTGTAPWYTGWGINDVAVVAGATSDGQAVFALLPAEAGPGIQPGEPMDTLAMTAARTVPLHLQGLVVPEEGIVAAVPIDEWTAADRRKTANVSPSVLGVADAASERLVVGDDRAGRDAGAALRDAIDDLRVEAYDLLDNADPGEHLTRRLTLRAEAVRLCVDAATALVASRGGRALLRSDDAQLLARWALFLTVQAQTADLRMALLSGYPRPSGPRRGPRGAVGRRYSSVDQ